MYIESNNHAQNAKARLISPTYPGTSPMCLQFWYNMYGSDVSRLSVYAKNGQTGQLGAARWTLQNNQGQEWQIAEVTIPAGGPFSVSDRRTVLSDGTILFM